MSITERGALGPAFEQRLKAALDRIVPPSPHLAAARYRSSASWRPGRRWRLAPALLIGIGAAGLALTAVAATGSPNPVIWTERAGSVIESVSHFPATGPDAKHSPSPEPSDSGQGQGPGHATSSQSSGRDVDQSPEPTEKPDASPRPGPSPSPDENPEPSPTPDSSGGDQPTPTPSPGDLSDGS